MRGLYADRSESTPDKATSRQQLLEYAKDLIALYEKEKTRCEALESANRELQSEMKFRRKLEEDLVRSEEKYRSLFENAYDAIYVTARDGLLVDANNACLVLFGFDKEEFLGTNVLEIYVDPSRRTSFQTHVEQHGRVKDFELRLRRKDGTVMKCVLNATVRRAKDGTILGYQGIVRDVTEQTRSQEVLHQAKKMEALAHMAGSVAHEIRNPLAVSSSAAQLLMDDRLPCHLRNECAEKIVSGINRASLIIENLLDFARPAAACEMKKVELVSLVRTTLKTAASAALSERVKIVAEFGKEPLRVIGNAQLLQRVFLNLFSTALGTMTRQGTLRVAVERSDLEAIVSVNHSGRGIAEDTVEKVFDPFFDAFSTAKGTSLGLSMAYSVVSQHGGSICVESPEGHGTIFRVSLPLSQPL